MKIIQITFGLSSGGAERLVVDLSNELVKNHEVTVLTLKDDNIDNNNFYLPELSKKVKYINAGIKKGLSIKEAFFLYKTIKSIRPDVVHIHLTTVVFYIIFSILFYRKPKYIETLHIKADKMNTKKILIQIKYWLYRLKFVKLCTISNDNQKSFIDFFKIKDSALIYNGRSKPLASEMIKTVKYEIENLKNTPDDIVFLHIGRCTEQKNQKMLVSVFNRLNAEGVNFILLIIGDKFNSVLGAELKTLACSNIHFLGAKLNIQDYYLNSDGFCLSSSFEGMPITLIEAFACGCIPISTPISGAIDIIDNNITGFVSVDIDEESYYQSIVSFISQRKCIDKVRLIKYYDDNLSMSKCTEKYIQLYNT
jgi:glycosyltransferase involved in cell wall biosynthesis